MNEPSPSSASAAPAPPIAIIDNDFRAVSLDRLPPDRLEEARNAIAELDGASLAELSSRGIPVDDLSENAAGLDKLTDPDHELGEAFAHLTTHCSALGKLIQDRHSMRSLAARIRAASNTTVHELPPENTPNDLSSFGLIFLDYYLDDGSLDTSQAEDIASRAARTGAGTQQQVVLMSSDPSVQSDRRRFRSASHLPGVSFTFVAKPELNSSWKVKAHLEMLAKAAPHSRAVYTYFSSVKENLVAATENISQLLDDLDLGDLAQLQNLALQADGHPLGDYLSWLLASHLTSLTFEGNLRRAQQEVDALEFNTTFVYPLELSSVISTFHHSALFSRNLGPLREHPRASTDPTRSQLPVVRLGDVYFDQARSKALVVLSADCQLAFAPGANRVLDEATPVLLVPGTPVPAHQSRRGSHQVATEGIEYGSEVYRVEWKFKKYYACPIGGLQARLEAEGFNTSNRDRLRPQYALQLQQLFANFLFTVGSPVPPPARVAVKATITRYIPETGGEAKSTRRVVHEFGDDDIYATQLDKGISIRITPEVGERLRREVENLYEDSMELLEGDDGANSAQNLKPKVEAIKNHLDNDDKWIAILGDHELPKAARFGSLVNGLKLVSDPEMPVPDEPVVLLNVVVKNNV